MSLYAHTCQRLISLCTRLDNVSQYSRICTLVSPLLNFSNSAWPGFCPSRSQMASTSAGWDEPEKICVCLILRIALVAQLFEGPLLYQAISAWLLKRSLGVELCMRKEGGTHVSSQHSCETLSWSDMSEALGPGDLTLLRVEAGHDVTCRKLLIRQNPMWSEDPLHVGHT